MKKTSFILLSLFFIFLNVADISLTQYALSHGAQELNPIYANNMIYMIHIKAVGTAFLLLVAYIFEYKTHFKNAIVPPTLFMILVVVWNLVQIFSQEGL